MFFTPSKVPVFLCFFSCLELAKVIKIQDTSEIRKIWLPQPSVFCGMQLGLLPRQIVPCPFVTPYSRRLAEVTEQERHWGCKQLNTSYMWRKSHISKLLAVIKLEIMNTKNHRINWVRKVSQESLLPTPGPAQEGTRVPARTQEHCPKAPWALSALVLWGGGDRM